jgi:hypothetical protein
MRPSTLRALIKELRSGGVSEFSTATKRETVTLKLAHPGQGMPDEKKPTVKVAPGPAISSELRKQLEALGVNVDEAQDVLRDVGIGVRGMSDA